MKQQLSEQEYRNSPEDSFSTVKDFIKDRKKYYRKYILHEKVKEEDNESMVLGSMVDQLLSDPDGFDDVFEIAMNNKPTGQMKDFCDKLYALTLEATSVEGIVTKEMDDLFNEAFEAVKYDKDGNEVAFKGKKLDYAVGKFRGTNCEEYYNQLRRSSVKYIVNASDITAANDIKEGMENSPFTRAIIKAHTEDYIEVYNQMQLYGNINGYLFKGKPDKVVIDHLQKIISLYDYKITWNVEDFDLSYKKMMYYLQAAGYFTLISQFAQENNMEDYLIEYPKFIVADSINYMAPLVWETGSDAIADGMEGFVDIYGEYHPGLKQTLDDIAWHKEKDLWNISRANYENKGRVKLKSLNHHHQELV